MNMNYAVSNIHTCDFLKRKEGWKRERYGQREEGRRKE
jgi:hypothetical protein